MIASKWIILVSAIEIFAMPNLAMAQEAEIPGGVLEKLQQQPAAQTRGTTVVPDASGPAAGAGANVDEDKLQSVRDLLEQVESNKGAQTGTVKAVGGQGGGIRLQHDLTKVRESYGKLTDAPFGEVLSNFQSSPAATATTPAAVEYRSKYAHDSIEQVVSVKSKNSVAANAFTSGEKPVSLKVNNAKLLATQISGTESQLPVTVKVGGETRQLKVGDVGRFGNFDVTILASSNNSTKPGREGPPYALRLQIMPVQ